MYKLKEELVQYHKEVFERIPPEKRDSILKAAAEEFAVKGFEKARISDIAKKAEVSHGSIYTYFETKDDILSYLIQELTLLQNNGFKMEDDFEGGFYEILGTIIRRAFHSAETNPHSMSVWLSLSFEYNSRFSEQIKEIELDGIRSWQNLLKNAVVRGEISSEVDLEASAYVIDSVIGNILRGYISKHEKMKLKYHFGTDSDKEALIDRIIKVVTASLK